MERSSSARKSDDSDDDFDSGEKGRGRSLGRKEVVVSNNQVQVNEKPPTGVLGTLGSGLRYFWSTREIIQSGDSTVKIKTTLRELIIYVIFLVILCVLTFGMMSSSMFYFSNVMTNVFLQSETPSGVNFESLGVMQDFWDYTQGPLLTALYPQTLYNGQNLTGAEFGFILNENKLLGVPRMRQVRVRNNSCIIPTDFQNTIKVCYDTYSDSITDTNSFGLMNGSAWTYQAAATFSGSSYTGQVSSYGGGGFIQDLQPTYDESAQILQNLMNNLWIDRGTRAVIIDFTLYNANINLFCVMRLVAEMPATGGVVPSWSVETVKLLRYVTPGDYFVMACEIFFVIFIVYYIIEEMIEVKLRKLAYFKVFWNILDIVVILIGLCCIAFDVYRTISVNKILDSLLENPDSYPDFTFLSYWQMTFNSALAIMVFFCWVKVFKYISFNKTMTQLQSTLSKCAKDLAGFAVMFFIIFLAFAQLGYLLFGNQLAEYSSFSESIFTLYRTILGDFNFPGLQQANRILGPAFFILYIFFIFFILLNMFLAIINDTYSEVKSDFEEQQNELEMGEYFKKGAVKMMEKLNIKKERVMDLQEVMKQGDLNKDGVLDFDEWRNNMKKRGYAEAEIEAVFSKYDMEGDKSLDMTEQRKMQLDLEKQRTDLDDDDLQQMKDDGDDGSSAGGGRRRRGSIPHEEAIMLQKRVERLEYSMSDVLSKLDSVLVKLNAIERNKAQRKETMSHLLNAISQSESNATSRDEMLRIVNNEIRDCDETTLNRNYAHPYNSGQE